MNRSSLLKKNLLNKETGSVEGRISNLVISFAGHEVIALVVDQGARGKQVVLPADVRSIGEDAIVIAGADALRNFDHNTCNDATKHLRPESAFTAIEICTTDGTIAGNLHDAVLNENWKVESYLVSIGMIDNVLKGYGTLPVGEIQTVHDERFIISEACASSLATADGGLLGSVGTVADAVSCAVEKAPAAIKSILPGTTSGGAGVSAESLMEDHTKEELYEIAKEEEIEGRSTLNKQGLADAIEADA